MFPKTIVPQTCTLKLLDWTLDACFPHFYIFVFYIRKLIDLIDEVVICETETFGQLKSRNINEIDGCGSSRPAP